MRQLGKAAVVITLAVAAAACGDDDDPAGLGPIDTPTFDGAGDTDEVGVTTSTIDAGDPIEPGAAPADGSTTTAPTGVADTGGGGTTGERPPVESVAFDDPVGDATPGVGPQPPPSWTDLAGGSLERQGDAYRLTIRLGGDAPATASGAQTMNVATFFDIDGDNGIEHELWVNLGADGWGPVWYDERGGAIPGEASNVTVVVDGDEVRLLFPDVMIDRPDRLRFSMASEYGELAQIGSSFARRDDAPDGDRAVSFPA